MGTSLTAREDCRLLDRGAIEDSAGLHDLQVLLAIVADHGLDTGVAIRLELDIERGRLARGGSGEGNEAENGEELHGCGGTRESLL